MRITLSIDVAGMEMLSKDDNGWAWYAQQPLLSVGVKVVAVTGYAEDWAAYLGPVNWPSLEVELSGDKLSEYEARLLFPWIKGGYRR